VRPHSVIVKVLLGINTLYSTCAVQQHNNAVQQHNNAVQQHNNAVQQHNNAVQQHNNAVQPAAQHNKALQ